MRNLALLSDVIKIRIALCDFIFSSSVTLFSEPNREHANQFETISPKRYKQK